MTAPGRTHYQVLGVTPKAPADEIRAAYKKLVARYHPDRHQGNVLSDLAAAELAALNEAYEVLSDPARRAAYDADMAQGGSAQGSAAVRREAKVLVVLLRALSVAIAIMLLVRFVPPVWRATAQAVRLGRDGLERLAGTPAVVIGAALVATGAIVIAWRVRGRRPR